MQFSQEQQHYEPGEEQAAGVNYSSHPHVVSPVLVPAEPVPPQNQDTRTLQALQALTDTALSNLSLEELLPELLERVQVVMQVDNVAILLLDEDAQELDIRAVRGLEEPSVGRIRIPVGMGFSGRIAATRLPLAVTDLSTYPVVNPLLREQLSSALGVPLLARDRLLGVVHIGTATFHEFTNEEEALLEQVADRIARAVERAQLFADAEAAQQAAEQRAAFLNATLEALGDGFVLLDAEGRYLYGNPAYSGLLGSLRDDPIDPGDSLLADVESHVQALDVRDSTGVAMKADQLGVARVLGGETLAGPTALDLQVRTLDGQEVFLNVTGAPVSDAEGHRLGAVLAVRDVTERRQHEQRVRDTLEAFIAITRSLVEGSDGLSHDSSSASDVDATEAVSSGTTDSTHLIQRQHESPIAHRLAELTRSILGCSRVSITALEGPQLLTHPVAIVGLSQEQEQHWWAEQELLAGKPVGESLSPEDRERLIAGNVMTFDLTRPPYQFPNPYGVTAVLAAPMHIQGKMVGLLGLDFAGPPNAPHNFTPQEMQIAEAVARLGAVVLERDRLLRERETARAEVLALTAANERMDEFLGIAGHELRTPITTMKANLQLAERRAQQLLQSEQELRQKRGTTKQSERSFKRQEQLDRLLHLLNRALLASERQERLVQDLLDISRISSGWLEYRMAQYDLGALVSEVVQEQQISNPNREIALQVPQQPMPITADDDRIGQVLANYLTNALKYSPAEESVSVTVYPEGSSVRVEVRDQGPGLSPEQQQRLFERFHRVQGIEVVSGSGVGLGLGLYISKIIVEQHGGMVGVESVPGEGSTFWFTLPILDTA